MPRPYGGYTSVCIDYVSHVARHPSLDKDLMLGMMSGTRRSGGQRRQWLDNVKDCQNGTDRLNASDRGQERVRRVYSPDRQGSARSLTAADVVGM